MKEKGLKWNLDDIVKLEDYDSLCKSVERDLKKIPKFYKKMRPSMSKKAFREFLEFDEKVEEQESESTVAGRSSSLGRFFRGLLPF